MMGVEQPTGWVQNFSGVIAASVTPFNDDGSVSHDRIPGLVDFLVDRGVDGIMVGGTTGEFVTMTPTERSETLASFVDACNGRVPIVAHVGAPDPRTAVGLTRRAMELGADAVAAMTPQFFPATNDAIERYFAEVAAAAPALPLLVYEFPSRAGNSTSTELYGQLMGIPNLAGIKVSADRLEDVTAFLPFEPNITVVCGNDSLQADFVASGGHAVVSGNAAVYPEISKTVFESLMNGADGTSEREVLGTLAVLSRAGAPDRLKELLRARGVDAGVARCRTYMPDTLEGHPELPHDIAAMLLDIDSAS